MDNKSAMKELETIYNLLNSIPVNGEAVDVMAAIRAKMRTLYSKMKEEADNG